MVPPARLRDSLLPETRGQADVSVSLRARPWRAGPPSPVDSPFYRGVTCSTLRRGLPNLGLWDGLPKATQVTLKTSLKEANTVRDKAFLDELQGSTTCQVRQKETQNRLGDPDTD